MDSVGVIFMGMAILFLVAMLLGHQKREHMSNADSSWNNIRVGLEEEMKQKYDFNVANFRKAVVDQNEFFDSKEELLTKFSSIIGVDLGAPSVSEVKNTNKLFDEKITLIRKDYDKFVKDNDIANAETYRMAMFILKSEAKQYMLASVKDDLKPKTVGSTISKIIG